VGGRCFGTWDDLLGTGKSVGNECKPEGKILQPQAVLVELKTAGLSPLGMDAGRGKRGTIKGIKFW
jgi:hypothetical protein